MSNKATLKPYKRGEGRAVENGRKGQAESCRARKANAAIRKRALTILAMKPNKPSREAVKALKTVGVEAEDVSTVILAKLAQLAMDGDTESARLLIDLSGEGVKERIELERLKLARERLEIETNRNKGEPDNGILEAISRAVEQIP